jgi:hypothetical protein
MTKASAALSDNEGADATRPDMQDDASDITYPGGTSSRGNERLCMEKAWKFRFITDNHNLNDHVPPATVHLHWLQAVQEVFGKDIEIMTNKGKVLPKVDTVRWTERQHKLHYDIHNQYNTTGNQKKNSRSILRAAAVLMTRRTRPTRYDTTL